MLALHGYIDVNTSPFVLGSWFSTLFCSLFLLLVYARQRYLFIKPSFDRSAAVVVSRQFVVQSVQLPLPRNRGFVAGVFQQVSKRLFFRVQITKVCVVSKVVLPRHDHHS